jgi:serine/threonine protein kinase
MNTDEDETPGNDVKHFSTPELATYVINNHRFEVTRRYEVKSVIGQGAYGVVVSAHDAEADTDVAIKKIFNIFDHDREYQKRILREMKILRHFRNHDNIVSLIDFIPPRSFDDFKDVYIVMELMDSNLRQLIDSNQEMTDQNTQYFIYQILRGMKFIHSANVLHRDIKPSNVLLNTDMDVKLCDFGLSRGIEQDIDPKMSTTYVATRWYRAPELLLMWEHAGKSLDVWSIGCMFAEILDKPPRRKVLFPGKSYLEQLDLILNVVGTPSDDEIKGCLKATRYLQSLAPKKAQNLQELYPHANPKAIDLLQKMLTFDPTKRITIDEALKHPYLESMHDPDDEPECAPFDFNFNNDIDTGDIKKMMYDEIMEWNRQENGVDGDAEIDEQEVYHIDS